MVKFNGDYLREHEVEPVLRAVAPQWRLLFATAIFTGLRRGELFALEKQDVDLAQRLLTVRRSHERSTTKGKHQDVIPIAAALAPVLVQAMKTSTGKLVFPAANGRRHSRHTKLCGILRSALVRAGIVTDYAHKCRRHACKYQEEASDDGLRLCPRDGSKLWPVGLVRDIRFHDLRAEPKRVDKSDMLNRLPA